MAKDILKANLVNMGAGANNFYIPQDNNGEIFKTIGDSLKSKMVEEKNLEIGNLKNEIARYYNYESTKFSDANLYKDDAEYEKAKKEREDKYNDIMLKISNANISQTDRDTLIQDFNTKKSFLGNSSYLREQNEMFQRSLTKVHGNIAESYDNAYVAAMNGDIQGLEYALKNADENYDYLVNKNLLGKEEATQSKMETMGKLSMTAMINQRCKEIMDNPNLDVAQKQKEIDNLVNNMQDDKNLISMAKELSSGEKFSDPDTLAKFMIQNKKDVKNIADRHLNKVLTNNHANLQNTDGLSLEEQDTFNSYLQQGDAAKAYEYSAIQKGEIFPFTDRSSFYNNEEVQVEVYGQKFDLSNPNDYNVPRNVLNKDNVEELSIILSDPLQALQVTQEEWEKLSDEQQMTMVYENMLDKVTQMTGAKSRVEAAKYIAGSSEMFKGITSIKGIPMDLSQLVNLPTLLSVANEDMKPSEKQRYMSYVTYNGYAGFINALLTEYSGFDPEDKKDIEKLSAWKAQMLQAGIPLPTNILSDSDKKLIDSSKFQGVGFWGSTSNPRYQNMIKLIDDEITNYYGDNVSQKVIDNATTSFQQALQSDTGNQAIESLAIGIFITMDNNPYKEQALNTGITFNMLEKSGAMDLAIKQFIRNTIAEKQVKNISAKQRYRIGG